MNNYQVTLTFTEPLLGTAPQGTAQQSEGTAARCAAERRRG